MRAALLASSFLCAVMIVAPPYAAKAAPDVAPAADTQDTGASDLSAARAAQPDIAQPVDAAPSAVAPADAVSPAVAAAPAISIDEAQRRQALQSALSARVAHAGGSKEEWMAIEAAYKQRDFQPFWTQAGAPTAQAEAVITHLKDAKKIGLDPADYPTPLLPQFLSADEAAAADLALTKSLLTFARHASSGRVSYTRVSGAILYAPRPFDAAAILSKIAAANNTEAALTALEPPQPGYKALKAQLAKEMAEPAPRKHGGKLSKADLIIANMERWRWLPRDLGANYVMVNIPQYTLQLIEHGAPKWATKIVVGQPGEHATPLLSETMKYITVNPTWNVPPSIIRNEYLPALERDPGALERIGLKISRNHDGSVRIYQPPGPKNALGRIRFNFPNPFLVYQHDTPNKNLFAADKRAFSHGCMRVQNPEMYAQMLLAVSQPQEGKTAADIRHMYGDEERSINLKHPIPVHITYQTAYVDQSGNLVTRDDIYGLDAAVLKLMRGPERAVADKPIPRNYQSSSKPVMAKLPRRDVDRRLAEGSDEGRQHSFAENAPRRSFDGQYPAAFFDRAVGSW